MSEIIIVYWIWIAPHSLVLSSPGFLQKVLDTNWLDVRKLLVQGPTLIKIKTTSLYP